MAYFYEIRSGGWPGLCFFFTPLQRRIIPLPQVYCEL
jgi:hypothetical protein